MTNFSLSGALLLLFSIASIGCAGTLDDKSQFEDGGGGAAACPDIETGLFPTTCGAGSCHNSTDLAGNLDLVSPGVAGRLVGIPGTCPGLLVDPQNPSASLLYTKTATTPSCGAQMPLTGEKLDNTELGCLLDYVEQLTAAP